ncbi:MAG: hypothetical protein A2836_01530 [Candidatus Taylorbacteria bacterium RIFCSPHIGHO2_01_FULL_45_63]|uniref:Uncharacterized protein n=1 Tax=Candidatus Taylorbacteria bacterium RIFCSPHIGHO2_02_FULL_45_35 TaxID=1802311 RepID=A0A1G2MVM3_9BACT|nr:MAG: hypothetical protein A2836_01530 [Candidatus Taylorbacteria bacterium RIFCSPHIGHO2_01_FULL_45_63]OHA27928.1 MAG: hypothetical protein A3D56_03155 [Candidatus Taylorbacteria bacterium RIFCSPHIGHO2_02_FULL_45_35]OHA34837.1 MAG: hypothetical protein A3A22_01130 [Candidatus Taylorbacteria bacterium RIFCSPLOWO2_01_FULL_45_34b]
MDPDEKQLLSETYELAKENNEILKKMRRVSRWAIAFRVFYWSVIILLSLGAYYLIQPYIDQLRGVYSGFGDQIDTIRNVGETAGGLN